MTLREPQQDRSRRTLHRLVEAATTLMADQGVESTSVAQIVKQARSSVGSFYARFDGKDDFVTYLAERVWDDATARWDRALDGIAGRDLTAAELVSGVVRLLVQTGRADRAQRRVLASAAGGRRVRRFHEHVLRDMSALLLARRHEFSHPAPERAIRLGYLLIAGSLEHGSLEDLFGPEHLSSSWSDEELIEELSRMYLSYLGSPSVLRSSRRDRDTARPLEPDAAIEAGAEHLSPDPDEPSTTDRPPESEPAPAAPEKAPSRRPPERVDFFEIWA